MPLRGSAKKAFIITQTIPSLGAEFFAHEMRKSLKQGQPHTPENRFDFKNACMNFQSKHPELPKQFLSEPAQRAGLRGVVFGRVVDPFDPKIDVESLETRAKRIERFREVAEKSNADGIVINLGGRGLDAQLAEHVISWEDSGHHVAFCEGPSRSSVENTSDRFFRTEKEAIDAVKLIKVQNLPCSIDNLEVVQRPGRYPQINFVSFKEEFLEKFNWKDHAEKLYQELQDYLKSLNCGKVVLKLPGSHLDSEIVEICGDQISRFGSSLTIHCPDLSVPRYFCNSGNFLAYKNLKHAVREVDRLADIPFIHPPQSGWTIFGRPAWDPASASFVVDACSSPALQNLYLFKKADLISEVIAIARDKTRKVLLNSGNVELSQDTLQVMYVAGQKRLEKEGGLLTIVNSNKLTRWNKHPATRLEIYENCESALQALSRHAKIPAPSGGWSMFRRPEYLPGSNGIVTVTVNDSLELHAHHQLSWNAAGAEIKNITDNAPQGLLFKLGKQKISPISAVHLHAIHNSLLQKGSFLAVVSNDWQNRLALFKKGVRLPISVFNNRFEAKLQFVDGVEAPSNGWQFFAPTKYGDDNSFVVLKFKDLEEGKWFIRGETPTFEFHDELNRFSLAKKNIVMEIPAVSPLDVDITTIESFRLVHRIFAKYDLVFAGAAEDSKVLNRLEFPFARRFNNVKEAVKMLSQ